MRNKKAISPLIATVLLIGFTVALAAVVMTWGGKWIREVTGTTEERSEEQIMCITDVNVEIQEDGTCYSGSTIKMRIENKASKDIQKFIVRVYDKDKNVGTLEIKETGDPVLVAFGVKTFSETKPSGLNVPDKVEIIPTVLGAENKEITCVASLDDLTLSEC